MDLEGTPGSSEAGKSERTTSPDSRIQPRMSGSSLPAYPGSDATRKAQVVPIRASSAEPDDEYYAPVWMQRANLVMKFLICVWIGMILTVLPWTTLWTENSLIMSLPHLRAVLAHDFVRGMVTGVGLIDIWIGIWEAVHYHDQRPGEPHV